MAKIRFDVKNGTQYAFPTELSRVPVINEKILIDNRLYQVLDVIFTPDAHQDAMLIISQMNLGITSPIN